MNTRILTVTDIHQSRLMFDQLQAAVKFQRPGVLAFVGDFLNAWDSGSNTGQLSTEELATRIAQLPVEHIVFTRGNHEDQNWLNFVYAWPHESRPLIALHGTAFTAGPLVMLGFPCATGYAGPWCRSMPTTGNVVTLDPETSGRRMFSKWLRQLMRTAGSRGRHLWLMHEPPIPFGIAAPTTWNPQWQKAVERFSPLVVVAGHDHHTPLENEKWNVKLGDTICVNVGQKAAELQYCVLDYEFAEGADFPSKITVAAHPWRASVTIQL